MLSEAIRKLDSLGFNAISDSPEATCDVIVAVFDLAGVSYLPRDDGKGDTLFNPAPRADLPSSQHGMSPDQIAWLNRATEELVRALGRTDHATSARRMDALAGLRRICEHIVLAAECLQSAKSGLRYKQGEAS